MIKYHWNNIFHNYVTNIVTTVIEEKNFPLAKKSLWEDEFIQDFMLEAVAEQNHQKNKSSNKKFTLGYLGHVKKIACCVMKNSEEIAEKVTESEKWNKFNEIYLNEELEREMRDLGGVKVRDQNPTEETFDFSIDEIRSKYSNFLNPEEELDDLNKDKTDTDQDGGNKMDEMDNIDPNNYNAFIHKASEDPDFYDTQYWKSDNSAITGESIDDLLSGLL